VKKIVSVLYNTADVSLLDHKLLVLSSFPSASPDESFDHTIVLMQLFFQ